LSIADEVSKNQSLLPQITWQGPKDRLEAWKNLGADKVLLKAISEGVRAPMNARPPPRQRVKEVSDPRVTETIGEYLQSGAIKKLSPATARATRQWTPTLTREKKDTGKIRLITDLRDLNRCHTVPKHRAETWSTLRALLREEVHQWGITLDLKNFFHHLRVHPSIQRWMRLRINNTAYQIVGLPFGWALSPWWSNKISKPIRRQLNRLGIPHAWYVDDVLILGRTPEETVQRARTCVNMLTNCGIRVNPTKSMMHPAKQLTYLGHTINLETSNFEANETKNALTVKLVKHHLKGRNFVPRAMAALAGHLLDAAKSNTQLHGLPAQLMKHAAKGVLHNKKLSGWNKHKCWNTPVQKSPEITALLKAILQAVQTPVPVPFRATCKETFLLTTDASNEGWGASLQMAGREIASCAQAWTAQEKRSHITTKEALASARGAQYLHHHLPNGCELTIKSDSTPVTWCWRKGSTVLNLNEPIRQELIQLHKQKVFVQAEHIAGTDNVRADWLSRHTDPKSYELLPRIYHNVCRKLQVQPEVDLFANRHNTKCKRFASWRTDPLSLGNAWDLNWGHWLAWINPPWEMIPRALEKIKRDRATALLCVPVWESQPWWRTLLKLTRGQQLRIRGRSLFKSPGDKLMPPPAWETLFTMVQG